MGDEQKEPQRAFGQILRACRERKGLSQEELALECGLDRTYISLLERGLRQRTISTLFALAKVLGIKPSTLITRLETEVG